MAVKEALAMRIPEAVQKKVYMRQEALEIEKLNCALEMMDCSN